MIEIKWTDISKKAEINGNEYLEEIHSLKDVSSCKSICRLSRENYDLLLKKWSKRSIGLGDVVEKVAQPIAKVIDKVLGTNVKNCSSCKKRKEALNKIIHF